MVFNTTFNNISVILWRPVLLVEETGGPRENHLPVASHWLFEIKILGPFNFDTTRFNIYHHLILKASR
jgi:hypothetical protein